ncbi:hypothetical protein [Vibrio spartinae]|uniref:Uncharacterized protein n=1 Tax=Vibrio spartinae TaxID=1918945 RepID=A0A1N6M3G3_9VIBR|nr:hypothetical protein [Vibrio spartinae]QMV14489.1 hypothetical protein Vspart_01745 [Vibrio spartinae]SIO93979.1 hypothetical protein VSP9026_01660 [Vibrio spartinae]
MSTLICTIELSKDEGEGITVHVKNKDSSDEHQIQLSNTSITLISKNGSSTTQTTQTADSLSIDVDGKKSVLSMNKETIEMSCTNFSLKASGSVSVESGSETSIKAGSNFKAQANAQVNVKGNMTTLEGQSITNIKGALIKQG